MRNHHARRNASFTAPSNPEKSYFVWTRKGSLRHAMGPHIPSCSPDAVQGLFEGLAETFGFGVARVVCNAICFPPYQVPMLYAVGTASRAALLRSVIHQHGHFAPGRGFVGHGDGHD